MGEEEARKFKVEAGSNFDPITAPASYADKSFVKITRNSRGYNWEIKVVGEDINAALEKALEIDKQTRIKLEIQHD
jgi:hypothetical protein